MSKQTFRSQILFYRHYYMPKYFVLIFVLYFALPAKAQTYLLSGRITDQKGNPVSFTSVYIRNTTYGTVSNEDGLYQFKLNPGTYNVVYRNVGYVERTEKITIGNQDERHDVKLIAQVFELKPVTVKASKDDPAHDIMKQVIAKRKYYLDEIKSYTCAAYVKGVQHLVKAPKKLVGKDVAHVLELDSTGKGILYQSESLSEFNFEAPDKVREFMIASKVAGENTAFSFNKASDLKANFYKNMFEIHGLSPRGFISPVADNAMTYYQYKLLGVSVENGHTIDRIEVIPKRKHDPVYRGFIYILEGDWRIYSVDLYLTKDNNLNFVDTLKISQQFVPVQDNYWMPESMQYTFEGNVLGFKFNGYYLAVYNNYKINVDFPQHFFNGQVMRIDSDANHKGNAYWTRNRPVPLTHQELRDYRFKDSVAAHKATPQYQDSLQRAKNSFTFLPYVLFGYNNFDREKNDVFHVHPLYETIFYNTVEGYGLNLNVDYTKALTYGRSFTISPDVKYGFAAKRFDANIHATYNFDPINQGYWYASFGSDIFDLSNAGTRSLFFNTLSTLLGGSNYVKYYHTQWGLLAYQRELANGILWFAQLSYANRQQLYNISFNHIFNSQAHYTSNNPLVDPKAPADDHTPLFPDNQALTFRTSLTFTFDQRYIDRPDGRFYEPTIYPNLRLNYRKGINGVLGSDVNYDFGSIDIYDDRLLFGLWGASAYRLTVGDFFNHKSLYFMDYNHFLGNQGTVFNPDIGNFHFLPFYTYSTDRAFIEAHYEHNFSGFFLNKIPGIRALKLEEIVGFNYLTEQTGRQNYSEFYVGLKRFFFRVDYGVAYAGNHRVVNGLRIFYGIK